MRALVLWLLMVLLMPRYNNYQDNAGFPMRSDTDSVYIEGDSLIGMRIQGEFLQYINGNVRLTYGETQVTADHAIRNPARQTTSFMGNAVLTNTPDTLRADTLYYDEELEIGRALGNVYIFDDVMSTRSTTGIHYVAERRTEFPRGLVIRDSTTTLTGETGTYWTEDKIADLAGNVEMISEGIRLVADSLIHYRRFSISLARGRVRHLTVSEDDSTWVVGERIEYNSDDSLSIVRGNSLFWHTEYDSVSVDTLLIRTDVLRIQEQQSDSYLQADGQVQIWTSSLAAVADSMTYYRAQDDLYESIWLYGNPSIWTSNVQLTGDTVKVVMKDGIMDSLFLWGNAFMAQEDSLTGRINQIKGRNLVSVAGKDSVRTFMVSPNAEAVYFTRNGDDSPDGVLMASGDEIHMQFQGNSLQTLVFSTDVQGTRYPETGLPKEINLDGLQWDPTRKPAKEQLIHVFPLWIPGKNYETPG